MNSLQKQESRTELESQDNLPKTKIKVHHKRVKSENTPVVIPKAQITQPELKMPCVEPNTALVE